MDIYQQSMKLVTTKCKIDCENLDMDNINGIYTWNSVLQENGFHKFFSIYFLPALTIIKSNIFHLRLKHKRD